MEEIARRTEDGRPSKVDSITEKQLQKALKKSHGIITKAAEILKCSPSNVSQHIARNEKLKTLKDQAKESVIDKIEYDLYQKMLKDLNDSNLDEREFQQKMRKWWLDRQARGRGYGEQAGKQRVGPAVQINIVPATGPVEVEAVEYEVTNNE